MISNKIERAINALNNGDPLRGDWYFAAMCADRKIIPDASRTKTFCTTGQKVFWYDPEYVDQLTLDEVVGTLVHECYHDELLHPLRILSIPDVDMEVANEAGDYVANGPILAAGYKLPPGVLVDSRFDGMTIERAYGILWREKQQQGQQNSQQGQKQGGEQPSPDPGMSGGFDIPRDELGSPITDKAELAELERDMVEEAIINSQALAGAGGLPGWVRKMVKEAARTRVQWQDVLASFINTVAQKDYSWEFPDEDMMRFGFILPSLNNRDIGEVIIAEDVSGSIDIDLHHELVAEGQKLLDDVQPTILRWLQFNSEVVGDEEYRPGEVVKDSVEPSGGTKFQPIFDHIREKGYEPECVVVMSDMESADVPVDPGYPVLWVSYGSRKAPFGELVRVER